MKNAIRHQLKEKAKSHIGMMGVLSVKNNCNGKQYIKGSMNIEALINKLKFSLKIGQYPNPMLQKDWSEYGENAFTFEVMIVVELQDNPYINYRYEVLKAEKECIAMQESVLLLY